MTPTITSQHNDEGAVYAAVSFPEGLKPDDYKIEATVDGAKHLSTGYNDLYGDPLYIVPVDVPYGADIQVKVVKA
ncbi:hypothetical protein EON82_23785 [bacterium]|nr:MAG: hypothetical protein EON82_23785 [bacterium]